MKAWPGLCPQSSKRKQLQKSLFPKGFLVLKAGSSTLSNLRYFSVCWQRTGSSSSVPILTCSLPPPVPSHTLGPLHAVETFSLLLQQQFWPPNANRNQAQDSVRAQQRLCHTRETGEPMGPWVNRRIEVLCILINQRSMMFFTVPTAISRNDETTYFLCCFSSFSGATATAYVEYLTTLLLQIPIYWCSDNFPLSLTLSSLKVWGKKSVSVHYEPTEVQNERGGKTCK